MGPNGFWAHNKNPMPIFQWAHQMMSRRVGGWVGVERDNRASQRCLNLAFYDGIMKQTRYLDNDFERFLTLCIHHRNKRKISNPMLLHHHACNLETSCPHSFLHIPAKRKRRKKITFQYNKTGSSSPLSSTPPTILIFFLTIPYFIETVILNLTHIL